MEKKNLALYIILSIVTCGIFALVWLAMLANDLRTMSNDESKMSGGMVVLLTIVTALRHLVVSQLTSHQEFFICFLRFSDCL